MMDTERSGLDEAMDVGSSTVSHLKSLKTAATFSKAGYGAALGGPFSAAIGAVIANRNQFAKILLVILAILLLPVLGEIEDRLKNILKELRNIDNAILFIDEIKYCRTTGKEIPVLEMY